MAGVPAILSDHAVTTFFALLLGHSHQVVYHHPPQALRLRLLAPYPLGPAHLK